MTRRAGFTLVELLVTIAILGILLAFVMPATRGAMRRGRTTACLSNLRQAGLLLHLHTQQPPGRLPVLYNRAARSDPRPALDTVILPASGGAEIYRCPSDNRGLYAASGNSYNWNFLANNQRPEAITLLGLRLAMVEVPLISDKEGWHVETEDRVNILYADGHVTMGLRDFTGP